MGAAGNAARHRDSIGHVRGTSGTETCYFPDLRIFPRSNSLRTFSGIELRHQKRRLRLPIYIGEERMRNRGREEGEGGRREGGWRRRRGREKIGERGRERVYIYIIIILYAYNNYIYLVSSEAARV